MTLTNFLYYGYDKKTRKESLDLIKSTNRTHAAILNFWFLALMAVISFFSHNEMFFVDKNNELFYLFYFCLSFAYGFCMLFFSTFTKKHAIGMAYLNMIMLISFGVLSSTLQPYMAGTITLVMIVLVAVAYIDTMFTMIPFFMLSTLAFILSSYLVKPLNIWFQDVYNVLIFFSLAAVLHYSFQHTRMSQFVTYLENIRIQQDLEVKSSFDALTSLLNRGRFFSMAAEILRAPHDEFLAFAIIDLDFFKQINDQLGHQMGDKAIQIAGESIQECLGINYEEKWTFQERALREKYSLTGRLGGDEFVALIRGKNNLEEAEDLLKKLLAKLNKANFDALSGIQASIGLVEIKPSEDDLDKIYNRADRMLYESKKLGKNRVTVASAKDL